MRERSRDERDLTRRRFVAGPPARLAAGAGLAAGVPAEAEPPRAPAKRKRAQRVDVVVVGAGLAGLVAATQLTRSGHSVRVLEARDRVGGRVWNHDLGDGHISERGGTFIGPTQNHVAALAKQLKIPTFRIYDIGKDVYIAGGERLTYSDRGPFGTAPPDPTIAGELATLVLAIDQLATTVDVAKPWDAPNAVALDGQTIAELPDRAFGEPAAARRDRGGAARDLRRRAAGAVDAVHAVLHRGVRRPHSTPGPSSATSTRAAAPSRIGWSAARSGCRWNWPSGSAMSSRCARRSARSLRRAPG